MKKCPQCQAAYFDQMIEFCLEDGAKLSVVNSPTVTEVKSVNTNQKNVETMFLDASGGIPKTVEVRDDEATATPQTAKATQPLSLKQHAVEKGYRTLEISTLVFALALNWLQWLYIERQNYGSITGFLFSAEFLIWVLLLCAGTVSGLLTLKLSRKKELAYAGLVILAINFLLLLVPKK